MTDEQLINETLGFVFKFKRLFKKSNIRGIWCKDETKKDMMIEHFTVSYPNDLVIHIDKDFFDYVNNPQKIKDKTGRKYIDACKLLQKGFVKKMRKLYKDKEHFIVISSSLEIIKFLGIKRKNITFFVPKGENQEGAKVLYECSVKNYDRDEKLKTLIETCFLRVK